MTDLLFPLPVTSCNAEHSCDRVLCFQARLEAFAGRCPVRVQTELCASHLGDTVQALTTWARDRGLEGKVTVLAIDQPPPGQARSPARPGDRVLPDFAFATIVLNP